MRNLFMVAALIIAAMWFAGCSSNGLEPFKNGLPSEGGFSAYLAVSDQNGMNTVEVEPLAGTYYVQAGWNFSVDIVSDDPQRDYNVVWYEITKPDGLSEGGIDFDPTVFIAEGIYTLKAVIEPADGPTVHLYVPIVVHEYYILVNDVNNLVIPPFSPLVTQIDGDEVVISVLKAAQPVSGMVQWQVVCPNGQTKRYSTNKLRLSVPDGGTYKVSAIYDQKLVVHYLIK